MKKFGLLAICTAAVLCASADNIVTLKVNGPDGTLQSYDIRNIDYIDFNGDMMRVYTTDGMEELNMDDINDMTFDIVSGIEEIRDLNLSEDLQVKINGGILTALLPEGDLTLRVYTISGQPVDMVAAHGELTYSLADLAKGTYVILVNDKAIKFIR